MSYFREPLVLFEDDSIFEKPPFTPCGRHQFHDVILELAAGNFGVFFMKM